MSRQLHFERSAWYLCIFEPLVPAADVSSCMKVCVAALPGITWNNVERRSVMASTADIQVNANRGRTTQELHREALSERWVGKGDKTGGSGHRTLLSPPPPPPPLNQTQTGVTLPIRLNMLTKSCEMMCNHADSHDTDNCSQLHG